MPPARYIMSEHFRRQFSGLVRGEQINRVVREYCDQEKINIKELRSGSRRDPIAQAMKKLMRLLVEGKGTPLAEAARQLGVSTSAPNH